MRHLHRTLARHCAVAGLTLLSVAVAASAQTAALQIDNFGKINNNYYRGAQPDGRDYQGLAALGIHTVIDLTLDGRTDEQGLVEAAGMKFVRIPLTTTDRPAEGAISQFLALVNDPANQPVYVHCQGGRHRTGTMTAIYRMTEDGWTADQAFDEMKRFKFEGFPGHPTLKAFVYDYYLAVGRSRAAARQPTIEAGAKPVLDRVAQRSIETLAEK